MSTAIRKLPATSGQAALFPNSPRSRDGCEAPSAHSSSQRLGVSPLLCPALALHLPASRLPAALLLLDLHAPTLWGACLPHSPPPLQTRDPHPRSSLCPPSHGCTPSAGMASAPSHKERTLLFPGSLSLWKRTILSLSETK